ncbi:hypothetical protein [uncultured Desulfobacter sp.]|uniref:hypothetical protein n=1 Tax=uncultured Desulfobacter sp. TaxID=240139 RepID=UPI002AA940AF|nr:hypothetical protein [uncultured Desulfobacter sp.]
MNKNKRQFFKNAATVGLGAVLLSSTNNAFASSAGNQLLVGENGDYPDISSALSRRAKLGVSCRVKVPVGWNPVMGSSKG